MEIYTVSLFGHREPSDPIELGKALEKEVENLIRTKEYVEFLVGRNGAFDYIAASTILMVRKRLDYGNCSLVLVLPYMTEEYRDNKKSYEEYYNSVEICDEAASGHFKGAFLTRNKQMVERSDLVLCCIEHKSGGAFQAVKYAKKLKKEVRNLSADCEI